MNDLSFNMESITSVTSHVSGLPDLGSLHIEILPSAKCLRESFTVRKANTSASYINSGSVTIAQPEALLGVKNRLTARCSLISEMDEQSSFVSKMISVWMSAREREPSKDKLERRGLSLREFHLV
jgi:hypothetical protein